MFRVALSHALSPEMMEYFAQFAKLHVVDSGESDVIGEQIKDMDGVLLRVAKLDAAAIAGAKNLKVIGKTGVGVDGIDVEAAAQRGIPVVITPGANSRSVAEYTVSALLAAIKKLPECHEQMQKGQYAYRNSYQACEFLGKNLFVVGFGNIGRQVAGMCHALGMHIGVYDAFVPAETIREAGYTHMESVEEGCRWADFISIHAPLTLQTRHMFSGEQFDLMKPDAILVNAARGELVDEKELIRYLEEGRLGYAALDVTEEEPPRADVPILKAPRVLLTPHIAAQTKEAKEAMAKRCIDGMVAAMSGQRWDAVADAGVYEHERWKK